MKTYNFEQAMEAVAHGIDVTRLKFPEMVHFSMGRFNEYDSLEADFDDFYAQDWVAYEGE